MTFVFSIRTSVMIMLSPLLVWFREKVQVFGQSCRELGNNGVDNYSERMHDFAIASAFES